MQLAARPGSPESLQQLVEIAKNPTANAFSLSGVTMGKEENTRQSRDKKVSHQFTYAYLSTIVFKF